MKKFHFFLYGVASDHLSPIFQHTHWNRHFKVIVWELRVPCGSKSVAFTFRKDLLITGREVARVTRSENSNNSSVSVFQRIIIITTTDETNCNCRNKDKCPLSGNCLASNVIYQAEVTKTDDKDKKLYIGMVAHPFKHRFNNHTKSFRDPKYPKETALSTHIWDLKNEGKEFIVN